MHYPTRGIFWGVVPYPPTPLLSAVLGRIRAISRPVRLRAPTWPRQPWYSSLVELSVAHSVRLLLAPGSVAGPCVAWRAMVQLPCGAVSGTRSTSPTRTIPLLQGIFTRPTSNMFKLHTWTLLGMSFENRDCLCALPASGLSRTAFNKSRLCL